MNPELSPQHPPPPKDKDLENGGGGGEVNVDGAAVLAMPGANLDAAEDDGDHGMKEEGAQQDDQSPDGALSPKEIKDSNLVGVGPAPPAQKLQEPSPGQSGQDNREAAHLNSI